jgi:hypothetical protein
LENQLRLLAADRKSRERAVGETSILDLDSSSKRLVEPGFRRTLKPFQLRNLATVLRLPHGADFSVPGAGTTTVALANFAIARAQGRVERLLVVAPIAAFEALKVDSAACLAPLPVVAVHTGQESLIPTNTDILLTNYNRVASDRTAPTIGVGPGFSPACETARHHANPFDHL